MREVAQLRCYQESHSGASNSSFRLPRLSKGHNRVRYKFNRHSSAGIYLRALHSIGGAAAQTFVKEVVLLRIGARGERERETERERERERDRDRERVKLLPIESNQWNVVHNLLLWQKLCEKENEQCSFEKEMQFQMTGGPFEGL